MGWLAAGSGYPALEEALKGLEDGKISEPVRTPRGCHIVMIQERQPSRQRGFADIHDEVRQALISEHAADYFRQLAIKYPVKWNLPVRPDRQTAAEPATTPR
jgi:parvulin-like peptidyl-prolyl isomerase